MIIGEPAVKEVYNRYIGYCKSRNLLPPSFDKFITDRYEEFITEGTTGSDIVDAYFIQVKENMTKYFYPLIP